METFEIGGLILESTPINTQIENGDKTTHDFEDAEIAIMRDGKLKRIRPMRGVDLNTLPDGTWRVNIDGHGDFDAGLSWFIMSNKGVTTPDIGFVDGDASISQDRVHKVVGRVSDKVEENEEVEETDKAPESTTENRIITIGDERFLMVDGQAYLVHE